MTAPTLPYRVYAICAGSGPVVIGRYESEQEQRRAYIAARKRLIEGGYSPDVRDIALGEDPAWRRNRQVTPVDIAMILGGPRHADRGKPMADCNCAARPAVTTK